MELYFANVQIASLFLSLTPAVHYVINNLFIRRQVAYPAVTQTLYTPMTSSSRRRMGGTMMLLAAILDIVYVAVRLAVLVKAASLSGVRASQGSWYLNELKQGSLSDLWNAGRVVELSGHQRR